MQLAAQVDALSNDDVVAMLGQEPVQAFDGKRLNEVLEKLGPLALKIAEAVLSGQPKSVIILIVLKELFRIKLV